VSTGLHERWNRLCERVGAFKRAEESDLTFDMLATLYAHPVRSYHNLDHIGQVLGVLDSVQRLADDRDAVEFALWLHDCVYFAEREDNEERSADAASMIAGLLGCPAAFAVRARELIAVTRHSRPPGRGDESLVADIDLSVLAAEGPAYDAYARAIRREFAFADDEAFRGGRIGWIERMLEREKIYATAWFFREGERAARGNLERELAVLGEGRLL
jgi:predicted metal-dependent HD superfamily phosphohydrolase